MRKIMKSKMLGLLLAVMLFSLTAFGCGSNNGTQKKNDNEQQQGQPQTELSPIAENSGSTENTDNSTNTVAITYNYDQEINIIEDNYRNYYEIFVASFCDSDGDGTGDINGILSKLDYITEELGFNGIWLMPIMPSPSYHKYDVTDYYTIDSQYGTLEDFQKLVQECDKRSIKLIIDFVFNHTSAQHPWFKEAVSYLETLQEGKEPDLKKCPSVQYYHFTKEYDGSEDYHRAGNSDWYYECVFWDQMPDLALENPELRTEIEKIAKFWLELGVDGFRLDAAKEFYSGETSKNIEVLEWFTNYVKGINKDAYIVGEVWDETAAISTYYESGITSLFDFPLAQYNGIIVSSVRKLGTSSASSYLKSILSLDKNYRKSNHEYIDAPFLSNHDTTRIAAQCVNEENQMKMAAGVLLTMNGSPFVYYGEEIGMNSMGDKDENKRLPMQWSQADATGMTKAPAGADEVVQKFDPVEVQLTNPLSMLNYYKRAIRIRNENPELARGNVSAVEALTTTDVCAVKKVYKGSEIVIVYNMNKEATTVDLKVAALENTNIRGYLSVDGTEVTLKDGVLTMPLYSITILK